MIDRPKFSWGDFFIGVVASAILTAVMSTVIIYVGNDNTDQPTVKVVDCPVCPSCDDVSIVARERARVRALLDGEPNRYCYQITKAYWLIYAYTCDGDIQCLKEVKFGD